MIPCARCVRALLKLLMKVVLGSVAAVLMMAPALAQFKVQPKPVPLPQVSSDADTDEAYALEAARHIYGTFPSRIYKGRLPPLLYGVAVTETTIDAAGKVTHVRLVRKPAAAEVGPWVLSMIRRAGPYPKPARLGKVRHTEVWLVHKSGKFQLHSLTEGQD